LADQGNFRPDQGIPALVRYLVPLPCRKSDRRDYMIATENQKRRLGEFVKSLVENTKSVQAATKGGKLDDIKKAVANEAKTGGAVGRHRHQHRAVDVSPGNSPRPIWRPMPPPPIARMMRTLRNPVKVVRPR
jgi:hypothetical protein